MSKILKAFYLCLFYIFIISSQVQANNLTVSDVSIVNRSSSDNTITVSFDISWENSWRTKINHDAVWVTVRLYDPAVNPTSKLLCQLTANGLNPSGTETGSNANLEISVPSDKYGAFIRPSNYGVQGAVSSADVALTVDYTTCGFDADDNVYVSVSGIEMVYVPEGSFYAGDDNASTASLTAGVSDSNPWFISSGAEMNVSNVASQGYRYVSNGNTSEDETGASFTIPLEFPNGYGDFYAMKYEITEGQWVDFINSLPTQAARMNRDITNAAHKNSDAVLYRNTISCSGSPLICATTRPSRALNYLSWMDLAAYLDWMALRPITELEFEKMARGPLLPVASEYAWGTTDIVQALSLSAQEEDGAEVVVTPNANAHFNSAALSGGDAAGGSHYAQGALRGGIFATASSTRISAGSSYYGIMDLSGNISEAVVTIGNAQGRAFNGNHGDGVLTTATGYEGNANQATWPGMDVSVQRGITGALGSGYRGGAWNSPSSELRISDRTYAAQGISAAANYSGGRGARTYGESY